LFTGRRISCWHIASFLSSAAFQSLSERSGHQLTDKTAGLVENDPSLHFDAVGMFDGRVTKLA